MPWSQYIVCRNTSPSFFVWGGGGSKCIKMKETLEKHFHRKPAAKHFVAGIFAHAKSKTYANNTTSHRQHILPIQNLNCPEI